MTLFACRECDKERTGTLHVLSAVPEAPAPNPDPVTAEDRRAPATMPRGRYAVETEPWGPSLVPAETEDPQTRTVHGWTTNVARSPRRAHGAISSSTRRTPGISSGVRAAGWHAAVPARTVG